MEGATIHSDQFTTYFNLNDTGYSHTTVELVVEDVRDFGGTVSITLNRSGESTRHKCLLTWMKSCTDGVIKIPLTM